MCWSFPASSWKPPSSLDADAATVLNVSEDHMDRYSGMAEYAAAKARIFHGHGVQVLNREDVWSRGMAIAGPQAGHFRYRCAAHA